MGIKIKRLTKVEEYMGYLEKVHEKIDVKFPLEYVFKQKVFALFNQIDEIVGGYSIITNGPFRVVDSLKSQGVFLGNLDSYGEITGLWLDGKYSKRYSTKMWLHIYWQLLISQKKSFLYAYSFRKKSLEKLYI